MSKKTIWITGGSTGIGKALAIKFANKGWNVAVSARRVELLDELSSNYENISSFPLDVTDKGKCIEVFNQIKTKFENIDICFFSTGTWNPKKEKEIDVEQMEDVFKVNFNDLDSMRYAMTVTFCIFIPSAISFFIVSRVLPRDWAAAEKRNLESTKF